MADPYNRLDMEMLKRGLADSRAKAQAMISEKRVTINGIIGDSEDVEEEDEEYEEESEAGIKRSNSGKSLGLRKLQKLSKFEIGSS
ncbi:MAG: hypothetical protein JKX94_10330, partial [Sneathiella sp.]|nr:hypothetical protein [Sneathiella sp.]